jgi:WD40 repeat protein
MRPSNVDSVDSARFKPDGARVVTALLSRIARVDADGRAAWRPMPHRDVVTSAEFSLDGTRIVTASMDGTAQVWTRRPGRRSVRRWSMNVNITCARLTSVLTARVTGATDDTARIGTRSGVALCPPLHHEGIWSVRFSPDGTRPGYIRGGTVQTWTTAAGVPIGPPLRLEGAIDSAEFSPDGTRVIAASGEGARLWDPRTGDTIGEPMRHDSGVVSARFSSDGTRVVTGSDDKSARVWDARTGAPLGALHPAEVSSAQFSPDGTRTTDVEGQCGTSVDAITASPQDAQTLADLAEAVSGLTVNEFGAPVPLSDQVQRLEALRAKAGSTDTIGTNAAFAAFLRWFFAAPTTRSISPLSTMTPEEYRRRADVPEGN